MRPFFHWYNHEHRHSGIGLMTPAAVHFGTAHALQQQRAKVLTGAYHAHPERFKGKFPTPPELPTIVGINLPKTDHPNKEKPPDTTKPTQQLLTNFSTQVSQSH